MVTTSSSIHSLIYCDEKFLPESHLKVKGGSTSRLIISQLDFLVLLLL